MLLTHLPLTSKVIADFLGSFDLHALDTPPAFILSQDQTLSKTLQLLVELKHQSIDLDEPDSIYTVTLLLSKVVVRHRNHAFGVGLNLWDEWTCEKNTQSRTLCQGRVLTSNFGENSG